MHSGLLAAAPQRRARRRRASSHCWKEAFWLKMQLNVSMTHHGESSPQPSQQRTQKVPALSKKGALIAGWRPQEAAAHLRRNQNRLIISPGEGDGGGGAALRAIFAADLLPRKARSNGLVGFHTVAARAPRRFFSGQAHASKAAMHASWSSAAPASAK